MRELQIDLSLTEIHRVCMFNESELQYSVTICGVLKFERKYEQIL